MSAHAKTLLLFKRVYIEPHTSFANELAVLLHTVAFARHAVTRDKADLRCIARLAVTFNVQA